VENPAMHAEPRTDLLLTARDVAEILSINVRTLWRWVHQEIIPPPIKIGRSTRWQASVIQAYIDQKAKEAPITKATVILNTPAYATPKSA
jgi:predicted DNA-binding transcriptional regulator AlpA